MGIIVGFMVIFMMIFIFGINILLVMSIFIIGFGFQEDDGLIIGVGMIFFVLIGVLMVFVIYVFFNGGIIIIDIFKDWFKVQFGGV